MAGEGHFHIIDSLTRLSGKKQLAYALLAFERMLPNLIAFSKDTGFDDSCFLRARDAAWDLLQKGKNGTLDQPLHEACLKNAPDTEACSHELASHALNAALAAGDIVEFAQDGCTDHIAHVLTLAKDSVYLYLTSLDHSIVSSREEDARIAAHPLMQQELGLEEQDVRFVAGLPDQFDNRTVSSLKARAKNQPSLIPGKTTENSG